MDTDDPSTDDVIRRLARDQHGVMHRRQLLDRGATYRQIEGRLDNGVLIELGNGVYTLPSAPATSLRQYKAAELAVPDARLFGLAASNLLDLGATRSAAPEIVVHPSASHRCAFARVHRRRDVLGTEVKGIRVTSVPQTLVDLTGRVRLSKLEDVWTSALIAKRPTLDELRERVGAAREQRLRHRGIASDVLGSLTDGIDMAESELEAVLFELASQVAGAGTVVRQLALPWWKGGAGRGDVGVPDWRLILEADGRSWHARLRDFDADRLRDSVALANGWAVMRFGALHLRRAPDEVVQLIADAGRHRRIA